MKIVFHLIAAIGLLTSCTELRSNAPQFRILTGASRELDGGPPGSLPLFAPVQVQSSIGPPPPSAIIVLLPFVYHEADLRDCFLESSTDLVHWEGRSDFTVTNGRWFVKMDPSKPWEFYRAGGESLP
ncbi:MAG TPA: hypothetical protein VH597_00270 [Verrucomicrobiae bacterium]|jgi:hypothetical protein|nr:hypothetical protein [Verrucomicrobiae bacterium]